MPRVKTIEDARALAIAKGGQCLSDVYVNGEKKLYWQCKSAHRWEAAYRCIRNGTWCPWCNKNTAPVSLDDAKHKASIKGGVCLSTEYKASNKPLLWQCGDGHSWQATYNAIQQGKWCPHCSSTKLNLSIAKGLAVSRGGECVSEVYENNSALMSWKCSKGHGWKACYNNVQLGKWCPYCANHGTSKPEQAIFDYVKSFCPDAENKVRRLLDNQRLELDIYLPSKNLAIEYCGLYWHGEKHSYHRARNMHIDKLKACNEKGIRLITIFEDEWIYKEQAVKGYLQAILGAKSQVIGARKCAIDTTSATKSFLDEHHLQGSVGGLNYSLVHPTHGCLAVAVFAKINASHGKIDESAIELARYCVKPGFSVPGGLSRLMKQFLIDRPDIRLVVSYSDSRWSAGKIYESLGFEKKSVSRAGYWYFRANTQGPRHHRFGWTKQKAIKAYGTDGSQTEWEIMSANGWDRIWDCGTIRWELQG